MRIELEVEGLDDLSVASERLEQVAGSLYQFAAAQRQAAQGAQVLGRAAQRSAGAAIAKPPPSPTGSATNSGVGTTTLISAGQSPAGVQLQALTGVVSTLVQVCGQQAQAQQALVVATQQAAQQFTAVPPGSTPDNQPGQPNRQKPGQAAQGPAARLLQAQQKYQQAMLIGDPTKVFDARYRLIQAQKAMQRAQNAMNPPSRWQKVLEAIGTTRVSFGKGGMQFAPLINRIGQILVGGAVNGGAGGAAVGAALVVTLGVVATAFQALVTTINTAAQALQEFSAAQRHTGGTSAQIADLRARGLPGGEIAGMAAQLRQSLLNDPAAIALGNRLGVMARPGMANNTNRAADLTKLLDAMDKMTSDQQRRVADQFNLPQLLDLVGLSKRTRDNQRGDAAALGRIADPQSVAISREFNAQLQRVTGNFEMLMTAIGKPLLPIVTRFFEALANAIKFVADRINENPKLLDPLIHNVQGFAQLMGDAGFAMARSVLDIRKALGDTISSIPDWAKQFMPDWLKQLGGVAITDPAQYQAAADTLSAQQGVFNDFMVQAFNGNPYKLNTSALQQNTQATLYAARMMQEGFAGGAQRAREALGSGQKGFFLEKALEARALKYGAFGL